MRGERRSWDRVAGDRRQPRAARLRRDRIRVQGADRMVYRPRPDPDRRGRRRAEHRRRVSSVSDHAPHADILAGVTDQIGILGAGAWGTTLAVLLADAQRPVSLWAHSSEAAERLAHERTNERYLPGIVFPPNLRVVPMRPISPSRIASSSLPFPRRTCARRCARSVRSCTKVRRCCRWSRGSRRARTCA